jgi:hypothetical protein
MRKSDDDVFKAIVEHFELPDGKVIAFMDRMVWDVLLRDYIIKNKIIMSGKRFQINKDKLMFSPERFLIRSPNSRILRGMNLDNLLAVIQLNYISDKDISEIYFSDVRIITL